MTPYITEEACEVVDAVGDPDPEKLKVEIGDLLFLLLFTCDIAEDEGLFSLADVLAECNRKMVRRHPHVFGDKSARIPADASRNWEHIKQSVEKSSFGEIPLNTLPALVSAYRIQERAAAFGFDWDEPHAILEKIREELGEVADCLKQTDVDYEHLEEELGDLLFSVVNLSRFMKIDPERLLRQTVKKFSGRLKFINRKLAEAGKRPESATLEEMEELWQQSKTGDLED
jgi:tetrapyrrole methylase family protein/MazG family protein